MLVVVVVKVCALRVWCQWYPTQQQKHKCSCYLDFHQPTNLSSHVVVVARNWLVGEAEGKVWVNLRHQLKIKPQVILLQ